MNIVSDYDDFMVKGWKVSKKLPDWVTTADSWNAFVKGKDVDDMEVDDAEDAYKAVKGGHGKDEEDEDEREENELLWVWL